MRSITFLILLTLQLRCYSQNNEAVWENSSPMMIKRAFHTMPVASGSLYVIGGSTGEKNKFRDTTSVEMYNSELGQWFPKASMPEAITTSCSVGIGDKIYIIGGQQNTFDKRVKKVLMYDCKTDTWHYKSAMNIARAFHSVSALNNKIYAIGGRESDKEIETKKKDSLAVYTIEEYDIVADIWKIKAVFPFKHFVIGASTINDKIYILSDTIGHSILGKSAILEEYDPVTNTIKTKASLTPSRCDIGIATYNNKIYIFGGWNHGSLSTVEEYDLESDSWIQKTSIPYSVQNVQATTYKNAIYISGGINYPAGGNEKKKEVMIYYPGKEKLHQEFLKAKNPE